MAELNIAAVHDRRRPGISRTKKLHPKTDMTPMVDLGFLLISFFVITTEMSKPSSTELAMPHDGAPTHLGESNSLTVLLGKDNTVHYYHGDWEKAARSEAIYQTALSTKEGLGKVIREKQQWLDRHNTKEGRKGLMLLIKAGADANYGCIIDAIDEALIHDVKKYAVVKPFPGESDYIQRH